MKNKLFWLLFTLVNFGLLVFFLSYPVQNSGGDIVEYFGMNQSLISHQGINLTLQDKEVLKKYLNPGYFIDVNSSDQNGGLLYYMQGKNGNFYPVHFFFYSLITVPVRFVLDTFNLNPLLTLRLTNLAIFIITACFILLKFIKDPFRRVLFSTFLYLSPIIQFIIWPGPDVLYLCLLLVSIFYFFEKKFILAAFIAGLASWHSQPLIIIFLFYLLYFIKHEGLKPLELIFLLFVAGLPYLWNLNAFGILTPWTILDDNWTKIYGFGLQNASLKKLMEQFFDPNIGLFWYAPALLLAGIILIINHARENIISVLLSAVLITTAFFYQTNPAINYGTAGFGPTRHALFIIPFLIFYLLKMSSNWLGGFIFATIICTQIYALSVNNLLAPILENSLNNTPYAKFLLDNYPVIYNPTPEIFVDRTNHTDLKHISTAIYKNNNQCKKAFVLIGDEDKVIKECGFITDFNLTKDSYVNY